MVAASRAGTCQIEYHLRRYLQAGTAGILLVVSNAPAHGEQPGFRRLDNPDRRQRRRGAIARVCGGEVADLHWLVRVASMLV